MHGGAKVERKFRWEIILLAGLMVLLIGSNVACSTASDSDQPSLKPSSALVTKDASEMVLKMEDFEPGWVQRSAEVITKEGALSAHHAYFHEGVFYPPVVQNTVAVYPTINLAEQAYLAEKPENVSLEYPQIGDECFLDSSVSINQRLVFKKSNVVVWLWLQQDPFGDIKSYAKIVEARIG